MNDIMYDKTRLIPGSREEDGGGKDEMATDAQAANEILEQLAPVGDIRIRAMMGEYVLYYREKVIGGIYDGRVLLKKTASVLEEMPSAETVIPYPGAREMLYLENLSEAAALRELFEKMAAEIPAPRRKRKSGGA